MRDNVCIHQLFQLEMMQERCVCDIADAVLGHSITFREDLEYFAEQFEIERKSDYLEICFVPVEDPDGWSLGQLG